MSDTNSSKDDASTVLKLATSLKNSGRIDDAVSELRRFSLLVAQEKTVFPIDCFLRLPLYLQEAGQRGEAWEEFYKLIKHGYPNRIDDDGVRLYEKGLIYDKMRLFLQRDENDLLAVHYGILSYAHHLAALLAQERNEELASAVSFDRINGVVDNLVQEDMSTELRNLAVQALADFIRRDFDLEFIDSESGKLFAGQ